MEDIDKMLETIATSERRIAVEQQVIDETKAALKALQMKIDSALKAKPVFRSVTG